MLIFSTSAAVRPSEWEKTYREGGKIFGRSPKDALSFVDDALRRAGDSKDDWVVGLRILRGDILWVMGEFDTAKKILEPPLSPHLRNTEIEVTRLMALAMIANRQSEDEKAKKIADEVVELARKHVPKSLLDAYFLRGNITNSDEDFRAAVRLAKTAGDESLALKAEASLVRTLAIAERYGEAVDIGEKILPQLEAKGVGGADTTRGNLASAYFSIGDYDNARELFLRAEDAARKNKNISELATWLDRLGDVHLMMNDLDGASKWYGEARRVAAEHKHRQLPRALSNLAQIAIARGRNDEARALIEESIRLDLKDRDAEDVLRARVIRARLNTAAGDFDAAKKELENILASVKETYTRLQAEFVLGRMYAAQKKNDLADRYFGIALRTAVEARSEIKPEHRLAYFNTVAELFDSYVDFLVANKQIEKALEITEESRARTLAEGLNLPVTARKLDAKAIAKRLNATILCYWLGSKQSYLWTINAQRVFMYPLPPEAEVERQVEQYRKELIDSGSLKDLTSRGQKLFAMLVRDVPRNANVPANVIVVADGKLHSLNFETLVVTQPQPDWWIHYVTLSSAGSLQLLARDHAQRAPPSSMLLVGNPTQADKAFPVLAKAGEEMNKVGAHFSQKKVLGGAAATPKAFLEASPAKFDLIHFVAHGTPTPKRPLDSAVILAKDKEDRYKLFARDIIQHPLKARLVTISSCHGAGTRAYAGEGLVGLAWAFLRTGAEKVVAALWEVDDRATPDLMNRMYAGIRAGRDPAVALRDAKRALINSDSVYRKPKYWAPFMIYAGS